MDNDDYGRPERPDPLGLLLVFIVAGVLMLFSLSRFSDLETYYVPELRPLTMKEGLGMGKIDTEHDDLVSEIRKDLKLQPDLSIEIFIGPYQDITGEGVMIPVANPPGVVVLIDQDVYKVLTPEEKTALIAHELGHLTNQEMLTFFPSTLIQFQIEADTYSAKYADPKAMISVLNKIITRRGGKKPEEYEPRIKNLEKIEQSRKHRQAQ